MRRRALLALAVALAGCPHRGHDAPDPNAKKDAGGARLPIDATAGGGSGVVLPPAPPLPAVPAGLPALPDTPQLAAVTPEAVAFGALLFYDPRLSASGKTSCATCHAPAHGYAGGVDPAADGKPNLRRTPTLVNLAWATAYHWDGRAPSVEQLLVGHVSGQLGRALPDAAAAIAGQPVYAAHLARVAGGAEVSASDVVARALAAFVLTRYAGDAPWDRREAGARAPKPGAAPADAETAGYLLFNGKAQCAVCHTPPLYTNGGFARVGKVGAPDEGRGRVEPSLAGAFKVPTLRGAAARRAFFHTGDVATLDGVLQWYEHVGGDATVHDAAKLDPALFHVTLTPEEHAQLLAFVRALTAEAPAPTPPALP